MNQADRESVKLGMLKEPTPVLLMRLDLATEVLEGMDELGVETKSELQALLEQLERLITDED